MPSAPQTPDNQNATLPRNFRCQQFGLVVPAGTALAPVQRHGHYRVVRIVHRNGSTEKRAKGPREGLHLRILEKLNQRAESSLIEAKAIGLIKAP